MNFSSLFRFATCRTRCCALGAWLRRCVRDAFCSRVFPWASPLPSILSAAVALALFENFSGTTGLSDFPRSFILGFVLGTSQNGPPTCVDKRGTSRFLFEMCPYVHRGCDRAGLQHSSRSRCTGCGLPLGTMSVGVPKFRMFSRFYFPARTFPCQRFDDALASIPA